MKYFPFLLILFNLTNSARAQEHHLPKKFFSYGVQGGTIGWSSSFVEPTQGTVPMSRTINTGITTNNPLRNGNRTSLCANTSLGLHASFSGQTNTKDMVSFGAGIFFNRSAYRFSLPYTLLFSGKEVKYWNENDMYFAFLPSVKYSWLNGAYQNDKRLSYTYFG